MRTTFFCLVVTLSQLGCALAPGMQLDEGSAEARGRKQDPEYKIVPITPTTLTEAKAARDADRRAAARDPLLAKAERYEYLVGAHDVLSVIVWDHPELTIPAGEFRSAEATGHPVNSDGRMFYPHVGVVEVAGKSLSAIRQLLTERLAKYVERPQLDVRVVQFRSQKVQVTGEVMAPSTVAISDVPLRALDAINQAKGFSPEADPGTVVLTREGQAYTLDLQALNERGDLTQNWLLQDGDVLHVPDRNRNKVFVLGEIRRPASRLMVKGRMNLAEAIGDAEGVDQTAANGRIYVIRGDFSKPTIYRLDASSPDALLLAVQFPLQPYDVVFVSTYELTRWNRIMNQILPTIQALWQTSQIVTGATTTVVPLLPGSP